MFRSLLVILALATPAMADDVSVGDLTIEGAVIYKTFSAARAAGGYLTITNAGSESDLLIGTETTPFMAMIHESREEDGVMRMLHLDAVEIPAEGAVEFKPGSFHVMIMGLKPGDLALGETLDITLIFDRAGEVPVTFTVVDQKGMMTGDHSGHKMSN